MKLKPEHEMVAICFIVVVIILLASCLGGCTTTQPLQVTAPCPKPNLPPEPHYPVQGLKQGDSPATVAKAYVVTVQLQHDYINELKHVLEGFE